MEEAGQPKHTTLDKGIEDDVGLAEYNARIDSALTEAALRREAAKRQGPARRFTSENGGVWTAVPFWGYTIITPTFQEEHHRVNVATYARLGDVQQLLSGRLGLAQYAPVPITSLHLTITDLVSSTEYEKLAATFLREQDFRQAVSSCFGQLCIQGVVRAEVVGLSLFSSRVVIALVGFEDEQGYQRLRLFRDAVYRDETLSSFGIKQKSKYTGHITLAYVESVLTEPEQDRLACTLADLNQRLFASPLPLNVSRGEMRRFDDVSRFYRKRGWPVFKFR